jgi:hypothetical protein
VVAYVPSGLRNGTLIPCFSKLVFAALAKGPVSTKIILRMFSIKVTA